jgi:hypothetical protein
MSCHSTDAIDNALKLLLTPPNAVNFAAALPKRAPINLPQNVKYAEYGTKYAKYGKKYAEYDKKYSEYAR